MFIIGKNGSSDTRLCSKQDLGLFSCLRDSVSVAGSACGIMTRTPKLYWGLKKSPNRRAVNPARSDLKIRGVSVRQLVSYRLAGVLTQNSFLPKSITHTLSNQLENRKDQGARECVGNIDEIGSRNREVRYNPLIDYFVYTTAGV